MYDAPFTESGDKYSHSDQYSAVQKAHLFGDHEMEVKIFQENDPYEVLKNAASRFGIINHNHWYAHTHKLILPGIISKFTQSQVCVIQHCNIQTTSKSE